MDDSTTEDYLRKVIKGGGVFARKRMLLWDAFAAHKSVKTTAVLEELGLVVAYIPGGCTKFIQAPDVSWNKPFKGHVRDCYTTWMSNDAEKEYTPAGNPKAPPLHVVLRWIDCAWKEISKETILKSFEACAITTPTDGSGDCNISCFKSSGSIGTSRILTSSMLELRKAKTLIWKILTMMNLYFLNINFCLTKFEINAYCYRYMRLFLE